MSLVFAERSTEPERMDLESMDPPTAASILGALETVNARLGGVSATLWHLERFSRYWQTGQTVRFIDWGTGGADIPRAIVRWARRRGFNVEITGVDNNSVILDYARQASRDYPEIQFSQSDITQLPDFHEPFDYALSSLSLHHLPDDKVIDLLLKSDRFTQRGMIMNDLWRSSRAWAWIWVLTRLSGAHAIVQNDAPLSVKRAFTGKELKSLAHDAGLSYLKVHRHFGYRLTLAGEKI